MLAAWDFVSNPWVAWGILPLVAVNIGFWLTVIPLEFVMSRAIMSSDKQAHHGVLAWQFWFRPVEWAKTSRAQALDETRGRISFGAQVRGAALHTCGPTAVVGACISAWVMPLITAAPVALWPTWHELLISVVVMEIIGDFGLYWGHRVQHEVPFLWRNFHYYHHQLYTPSAISTLCIDGVDATLQGSIPLIVAAAVARPHPISFSVYVWFRISENVLNHCGMESLLLQVVSLKFLPGRASPSFHDYHHRFSNYSGKAKNYGENFYLWDWAFGTASSTKMVDK